MTVPKYCNDPASIWMGIRIMKPVALRYWPQGERVSVGFFVRQGEHWETRGLEI